MGTLIELPWPPASLSGQQGRHWHNTSPIVSKHRTWAKFATIAAGASVAADGDIRVVMTFYPPNRRGDRVNYPNRAKPCWDGIADALGVNDSRFLPAFYFGELVQGGKVVVEIGA